MSLKKIATEGVTEENLAEKWDEIIFRLGEEGVKESKPVLVACLLWLIKDCKIQCTELLAV